MNAECGHVMGVAIEDYIRSLNKLPPAIGAFVFPRKLVIAAERLTQSKAVPDSSPSTSNNGNESSLTLDMLPKQEIKMPVPVGQADASSNASKKKMWLAIVKGFVYIYPHFGGQLRLILNIASFDYSIQSSKQQATLFSLHKFGYPSFHFSPLEKTDFVRWKSVLISTMRYVVDPHAKFDMEVLVQDIAKVNAANKMHHQRSHGRFSISHSSFTDHHGNNNTNNNSSHGSGSFSEIGIRSPNSINKTRTPKKKSSIVDISMALAVSSASNSSNSTPSKSTLLDSEDEDLAVNFRTSFKQSSKTTSTSTKRNRSKLLSSVLVTSIHGNNEEDSAEKEEGHDSADVHMVRKTLEEMVFLEDLSASDVYTAKAQHFAGAIYTKNVDTKIKL